MSAVAEPAASREDLLVLVGVLREQNVVLAERSARLEERNERLDADNERLAQRIVELERQLNRNSKNSNFPSSHDVFGLPNDPGAQATEAGAGAEAGPGTPKPEAAGKPKPKARRGKRKGAPGRSLPMVDKPDKIKDHRPRACGDCGSRLRGAPSVSYARRQVTDIPMVTATVTEHRLHKVRCECGHTTSAGQPEGLAGSPTSYGPNLRALAVYLVVFHHVPVERTAQLIGDLTGAAPSTGWVSAMVAQGAALAGDSLDLIKALLTLGHILHADETTTKISGKRRWLHVACTERLTHLALAPRSREGARSIGILPHFRGTLVHDGLTLYDGYPNASHQLCGAHLIRELTAAEQDHPGQLWQAQVRSAMAGLNRLAAKVRSGENSEISPQAHLFYLTAYHHGVNVGLKKHPRVQGRKQSTTRNLLERLRDHAGDILRFADHPSWLVMTNNTGERALRPVKTQLKISGCHQSDTGAAAWLAVRSYLDSARKHGRNAFDTIREAFTGNPWMPPIAMPA